jgi:hypothetical protein
MYYCTNYLHKKKCRKTLEDVTGGLDALSRNDLADEEQGIVDVGVTHCFCDDKDLCNGNSLTFMMAVLIGLLITFGEV